MYSSSWRRLLSLTALIFSGLCCTMAQDETNIPIVENVVAIASADPTEAIVYWKPSADDRISMYIVYYKSNSTTNEIERQTEVISLANSAVVYNLNIGHHYTFTVSVGYLLNGGDVQIGPKSSMTSNSSITTGLTSNIQSSNDDNVGIIALVFYGSMLVLSMVVNLVLLIISFVLLKQLRTKYHIGNSNSTSVNDPIIEMRYMRRSCDNDAPRKPAREHSPLKETIHEIYNGKCSPAKEAEVEIIL